MSTLPHVGNIEGSRRRMDLHSQSTQSDYHQLRLGLKNRWLFPPGLKAIRDTKANMDYVKKSLHFTASWMRIWWHRNSVQMYCGRYDVRRYPNFCRCTTTMFLQQAYCSRRNVSRRGAADIVQQTWCSRRNVSCQGHIYTGTPRYALNVEPQI